MPELQSQKKKNWKKPQIQAVWSFFVGHLIIFQFHQKIQFVQICDTKINKQKANWNLCCWETFIILLFSCNKYSYWFSGMELSEEEGENTSSANRSVIHRIIAHLGVRTLCFHGRLWWWPECAPVLGTNVHRFLCFSCLPLGTKKTITVFCKNKVVF